MAKLDEETKRALNAARVLQDIVRNAEHFGYITSGNLWVHWMSIIGSGDSAELMIVFKDSNISVNYKSFRDALAKLEETEMANRYKKVGDFNGLLCSVCQEKQFETFHGVMCKNGHGGVEGYPYEETNVV